MGEVRVKRIYEDPAPGDGVRVLVDRLWPRGVSKQDAAVDRWLREVAPSDELRRWYGHDPAKADEFARRYRAELAAEPRAALVDELAGLAAHGPLTLVTATGAVERSNAAVLAAHLRERGGG